MDLSAVKAKIQKLFQQKQYRAVRKYCESIQAACHSKRDCFAEEYISRIHFAVGHLPQAARHAAAALTLCSSSSSRSAAERLRILSAQILLRDGDWEEASEVLRPITDESSSTSMAIAVQCLKAECLFSAGAAVQAANAISTCMTDPSTAEAAQSNADACLHDGGAVGYVMVSESGLRMH